MNTFKKLLIPLVALLALSPAFAQKTMTSTTLSVAVTSTKPGTVLLAAATDVTVGGYLYVDRQVYRVLGTYVSGSTTVPVADAGGGSIPSTHAVSKTVYVIKPGLEARTGLRGIDPAGSCTSTNEVILPQINPQSGNIWNCVGSLWQAINGPATLGTGLSSLGPNAAGTVDVGSGTVPFRYVYLAGTSGTPATNNFKFAGASTSGTRTITLPDASVTVSGTRTYNCGTTTTAACTSVGAAPIIHTGQFALGSASPSAATITGLSPAFSSSSSYVCALGPTGNTAAIAAGGLAITYVSGSSFTVTGPNTVTTQVNYVCFGN